MRELEKELENLPENFIVGVVMPSDNYDDVNMHLLSFLVNRKKVSGTYVSVSKPHSHVRKTLESKGISHENIHFIDCISKSIGVAPENEEKCVFVESPAHLTDLGVALHDFFISPGGSQRFLYIDSLSTLGIHNSPEQMLRFVHYLTGKMRIFSINGLMLSLHEDSDEKLKSELGQFCDKIIHL